MTSLGYNLYPLGRNCTSEGQTANDLLDVDPQLSDPAMNGGFGETLAPARTSPAINGGDPGGCLDEADARLTRDQRGVARADRCDIGAFEYQP
jgi:hypothetical protein